MMMSTWGVVLVYLLAFALVQLVVYRYLRRRGDDEDGDGEGSSTAWMSPPGAGLGPTGEHVYYAGSRDQSDAGDSSETSGEDSRGRARDRDEGGQRRCPNCGTRNEADEMYTFCRNCVSRLPG